MVIRGLSCGVVFQTSAYTDGIIAHRQRKDEGFRTGEWSPILESERARFAGLKYYPPDEKLRFELTLEQESDRQEVKIGTSDGEVRVYLRRGRFRFAVDGTRCVLSAYVRTTGEDPSLFVPFRDATSGSETYGAGRYLDVEESQSGEYVLDFNHAYNPYCAYDDSFSCPLAPRENWLTVAIRAGERHYG